MKVALATWNGRVSPVFDVARQVLLLDVKEGRVVARHEEPLPGTEPQAQAERLATLAPQTLICGAISQPMAALLEVRHIRVIPFIAGDVEQVLGAWLLGTLPNSVLSMPGCCGRRRCHGGRAGGRGRRVRARRDDSLAQAQRSPSMATTASLHS
jgi:predicted Fe-Mo cluster-binding NifX family protein